MQFLKAPAGWSPDVPNPFTADGLYGSGWSCFSFKGGDNAGFFTGRSTTGCWFARFGVRATRLEERIIDYIRYENDQGRTVIIDAEQVMDVERFIRNALPYIAEPTICRPCDPQYLVHTTTIDAWNKIRSDGELKAAILTAARADSTTGVATNEIAKYLQNEPLEYKQYIMFGGMSSTTPEKILASYMAGKFLLDDDTAYSPGVRLYVDNHRIIRNGLATRDGLHEVKVHLRLPLKDYLLASVSAADFDPNQDEKEWTPRIFVEKADEYFKTQIGIE